jgi:hypothetical protein
VTETTLFFLRCFLATAEFFFCVASSQLRNSMMTRRSLYLAKAKACADAAKKAHDLKACIELLQVSERFTLLANHAAKSELHDRKDEQRAMLRLR